LTAPACRPGRLRRALAPLLAVLAALAVLGGPLVAPAAAQRGAPDIEAEAAYLVEASTGDVILARDEDERRAIASTTKLMTALVAREALSLDRSLMSAGYDAAPIESQIGLQDGERLTVRDLLRALLLPSANDAAATLAEGVAGSEEAFVRRMNARASELGLRSTSFANPIGLDDPDNFSTARDLTRLALAARRDTFLRRTFALEDATLASGARTREVDNRNTLVTSSGIANGIKTGRTQQAGYVLVGSATRDGVTVVASVLGTDSEAERDEETLELLEYGLDRYERVTAVRRGDVRAQVPLAYREGSAIAVAAGASARRTLPEGERLTQETSGLPEEVDGPLERGDRLGTLVVRHRGRVVAEVPLVATRAVQEAGVALRMRDLLSRTSTLALLVALAACSVPLVLLRRRAMARSGSGRPK